MVEITKQELECIKKILIKEISFNDDGFRISLARVDLNERLKYLTPLVIELKKKGINLKELSPELYEEYNTINQILNDYKDSKKTTRLNQ